METPPVEHAGLLKKPVFSCSAVIDTGSEVSMANGLAWLFFRHNTRRRTSRPHKPVFEREREEIRRLVSLACEICAQKPRRARHANDARRDAPSREPGDACARCPNFCCHR